MSNGDTGPGDSHYIPLPSSALASSPSPPPISVQGEQEHEHIQVEPYQRVAEEDDHHQHTDDDDSKDVGAYASLPSSHFANSLQPPAHAHAHAHGGTAASQSLPASPHFVTRSGKHHRTGSSYATHPLPTATEEPSSSSSSNFHSSGHSTAGYFRSHMKAVAFLTRLSHLIGQPEEKFLESEASTMGDEQFLANCDSMPPDEMRSTIRHLFGSLQQFRLLLFESKNFSASDLDKESTFNRIVTRIRSVVAAEHVLLLLLDKGADSVICVGSTTHGLRYSQSTSSGWPGAVLRDKKSLNIRHPTVDAQQQQLAKALNTRIRAVLAVPVLSKMGQISAVLLVINKKNSNKEKAQYFSEQDQHLVEFISILAGHVLENALMFDEALTRRHQTECLLQISELLAAEVDSSKVVHRMIEAAYLLVNAEKITLFMLDSATDELVSVPTRDQKESIRLPISKGIVGYSFSTNKTVRCPDARKDWRFDQDADERPDMTTVSLLVVPVSDNLSKPIAVIAAYNKRAWSHSPEKVESYLQTQYPGYHQAMGSPSFSPSLPRPVSTPTASAPPSQFPANYFTKDEEIALQSMAVSAGIILRKAKLYEEAIAAKKKSEALLEISELMSADLSTSKIMAKIVQASYLLVNCECISLYMIDEKRQELVCEVSKDVSSKGRRVPIGSSIVGHCALTSKSLNITDAPNDWRFERADLASMNAQTVLAMPIKDHMGKNSGVLELVNKRSINSNQIVPFTNEDEEVLKSLSWTAGAVLRKAKLFDEAILRRKQTEALLQIMSIMSAELGSEKIMQRIIQASYTLVEAERITLFSVDPKTQELVCQVSKDTAFQGARIPYGYGIVGHVALSRKSLNISNAYEDPRFDPSADKKTGYKTHSILTVPVTDRKGASVAIIQAVNKRNGESFNQEDTNILESMAVNAGMLLEKSSLYDQALVAEKKARALVSLVMTASREDQSTEWIIHEIARVAYDALGSDRINIFFVDQVKEEMVAIVDAENEGWTVPLGKGLAGYCGLTGETVNCVEATKHPKFVAAYDANGSYRPKSVLCMAVKNNENEVIAVIQAVNKRSQTHQASVFQAQAHIGADQRSNVDKGTAMSPLKPDASSAPFHPMLHRASSKNKQRPTSPWASIKKGVSVDEDDDALPPLNVAGSADASSSALPSPPIFPSQTPFPPIQEEPFENFTYDDEDILRALCAEVRSLLVRHIREAMIELNQLNMNDSVYSLMDMFSGVPTASSGKNNSAASIVSRNAANFTRKKTTSLVHPTQPIEPLHKWPSLQTSRLSVMHDLDFNVWTYTPDDLLMLTYDMFSEMGLIEQFQMPTEIVKNFFLSVRQHYRDNPFHNWYHGFSVLHFSYLCLRVLTQATNYLTQQDVLSLLIASLCHDIDHPGNTNSFEINTGSELALIHNDISVLEAHHCVTTFRILRQKQTNILCNLRKDTFQSVRKTIVSAIMATDMLTHFDCARNLDKIDAETPFNIKSATDRQTVVNILIHSSDLSAQCFPTSVAKIWEERITREFENQAAKEKSLGLPVAEFMNNLTNPNLRRQNQVNFIDVVLVPWWRAVTRLLPGLKICYKNLLINRNYYDAPDPHSSLLSPEPLSSASTAAAASTTTTTAAPAPAAAAHANTHSHTDNQQQQQPPQSSENKQN